MDIFWNYTIRVALQILDIKARCGRAFANPWATPGY